MRFAFQEPTPLFDLLPRGALSTHVKVIAPAWSRIPSPPVERKRVRCRPQIIESNTRPVCFLLIRRLRRQSFALHARIHLTSLQTPGKDVSGKHLESWC